MGQNIKGGAMKMSDKAKNYLVSPPTLPVFEKKNVFL